MLKHCPSGLRGSSDASGRRGKRGAAAERRVAWWYRLRGYRVLGLNVRAGRYEIDVVVRRGQRVVFVEVKERGETSWGAAVEAVDVEKQRRIRQAAEVWLRSRAELRDCVKAFDVVTVGRRRIDRVPRAF